LSLIADAVDTKQPTASSTASSWHPAMLPYNLTQVIDVSASSALGDFNEQYRTRRSPNDQDMCGWLQQVVFKETSNSPF
jgi:hypothetical protein